MRHLISNLNIKFKNSSKFYTRYLINQHVKNFISLLPENGRLEVLEIGPKGNSWFRQTPKVANTVSLDIDPANCPDYVMDVCDMSLLADGTYDVVALIEVLEHVHDPKAAMQEVFRVLKPGGLLLMTTPYLFPIHDEPYDFYRYTRYGLKRLCSAYQHVEVKAFDYFFVTIWVQASRLHMIQSKAKQMLGIIIYSLILPTLPVCILLDFLTKYEAFASRYITIARK